MSLNKKLNLTLVLVTTLILSGAGLWNVYSIRHQELQRLEQDARLILQRLHTTLPQTLWDFAPQQAQIIIDGERNNPVVVAIQIQDGENAVFAKTEKDVFQSLATDSLLAIEQPLVFYKDGVAQNLGSVKLSVTKEKVFESVNQTILSRAIEILLLELVLSIALAYALGHMVMSPLSRVLHSINGIIADRDLSRRIRFQSRDELGSLACSIDEFLDDINLLVTEMNQVAHTIQATAQSALNSHQTLHTEIHQQRGAITQLKTAIGDISETARQVQHKSGETADLVGIAQEDTGIGLRHVRDTAEKISDLSDDVGKSAEAITQLKLNVDAISQVLDVIVTVAEQTNLLALNAAIEAARAGDTGRGFAVVADEVRSLAQRTQQSTREITSNLEQLNLSTDKTVTAMRDSVPKARQSIDSAKNTGASIDRISSNVNRIQQHAREINAATDNQNSAIVRIQNCFGDINQSIEHTLAVANTAEQLNRDLVTTLTNLQNLAGRFKTRAN